MQTRTLYILALTVQVVKCLHFGGGKTVNEDGVEKVYLYRNDLRLNQDEQSDNDQFAQLHRRLLSERSPSNFHPPRRVPQRETQMRRSTPLEEKLMRTEAFKTSLLSKLRMTRPPNITSPILPRLPFIEEMLRESFEKMQSDEAVSWEDREASSRASTLRVLHFCKNIDSTKTNMCKFNLKASKLKIEYVTSATLGVYVKFVSTHRNSRETRFAPKINLYQILKDGTKRLYTSKVSSISYPASWVEFDVKSLVQDWLKTAEANKGVEFALEDTTGALHAGVYQLIVSPDDEEHHEKQPYLDISFDENDQPRRNRRHVTNVCDETSNEHRCCRYPLHIDFKEMQWDWIIMPRSYDAYYCSGDCPFLFQQNNPYAHPASQSGAPGVCCSAKNVSPIELIYIDNSGNIVNGKVPAMSVDACSCS